MDTDFDEYIDFEKLAKEFVNRSITPLFQKSEAKISKVWAKYKNSITDEFEKYLIRKIEWCIQIKSVLFDQRHLYFHSIYVEPFFLYKKTVINEDDFFRDLLRGNTYIVGRKFPCRIVSGPAGIGKSLCSRSIFFKAISENVPLIPILVELKSLNRIKLTDIYNIIKNELNSFGANVSEEQVKIGMQDGLFLLILDGFDELKNSIESHYEKEICAFTKKYERCPIVVTSRPMERVEAWEAFEHYIIDYLDKRKCIKLIGKVPYDQNVKQRFIEKVENEYFDMHEEFLRIPLFCIIMLLTYSEVGKVSERTHEFFEDAFHAVWIRHDARKEGFERQKYTKLDRSDFTKFLCAFSLSSYLSEHFDLKYDQFKEHCLKASKIVGIDVNLDDFIKDTTVSTCVMIRDGTLYKFIHRMFQEYFVALFISEAADDIAKKVLYSIWGRQGTDHVVSMAISINKPKIEKLSILDKISTLNKLLKNINVEYGYEFYSRHALSNEDAKIIRKLYQFKPTNGDMIILSDINREYRDIKFEGDADHFYHYFEEIGYYECFEYIKNDISEFYFENKEENDDEYLDGVDSMLYDYIFGSPEFEKACEEDRRNFIRLEKSIRKRIKDRKDVIVDIIPLQRDQT